MYFAFLYVLVRAVVESGLIRPCVVDGAAPQDHGARWARLHRLVRVPLPPLQGNQCPTSIYISFGWRANAALEILNCEGMEREGEREGERERK
jgi:hypothetical protein